MVYLAHPEAREAPVYKDPQEMQEPLDQMASLGALDHKAALVLPASLDHLETPEPLVAQGHKDGLAQLVSPVPQAT